MAEVVQLSIEYSTAAAVAQVRALDTQLNVLDKTTKVSTSAMKGAGLGALKMAEAMTTGNISAVGLASSMGRVASVLFGPVGIALATAAAAFQIFSNQQEKSRQQAEKFQKQLRDTDRMIDDLLNPGSSEPFAKEIQRLTDEIDILNESLEKGPSLWQKFLRALALGMAAIGKVGGIAPDILDPQGAERRQRDALRNRRAQLTPEAAVQAEITRFNAESLAAQRVAGAMGRGQVGVWEAQITALEHHLQALAELGPPANEAFARTARELDAVTRQVMKYERALKLQRDMLFTVADAIEDFVTRGTFAFKEFIDNIFRLLFRDFTSQTITGFLARLNPGSGSPNILNPTGTSLGPPDLSGVPVGLPSPSIAMNVTYNVSTPDASATQRWIESNAPVMATTLAKQVERSVSLRRKVGGRG